MENHILEGSYPNTVPAFTQRDTNSNHKVPSMIAATNVEEHPAAEKTKKDVSPSGTPARERTSKRQKFKPGAGSKDFTKAGPFCCKEGAPIVELFPTDLSKKYCSFFCFHDKKFSKPKQSCDFKKRSLPMIKPRFSNTVMPVVERSGLTGTLLPSIGLQTFPGSSHTS
jgi:hypothetical protein